MIQNIFKKTVAVITSFCLLFGVTAQAIDTTEEICVPISSESFGYTGDVSGKRVYTKEEFTYECTITETKIGTCKTWKTEYQDFNTSGLKNDVYYQSEKFQGSIGEVLAVTQAYDKINGIWSGWHGLCQTGADDGNWDWASDPYVLAGFALSAISGGIGMYADAAVNTANAASTAAIDATKEVSAAVMNGGMETAVATATTTQTASAAATTASVAAQNVAKVVNYSVCAARAGLDAGQMVEEYQADGEPCDPVDEICGEEEGAEDNSNIFTVPEEDYEQILNNNPDIAENLVVLDGEGTGVLTVKVVSTQVDTTGMDSAEAKAAAEKAKKKVLNVKAAMTTLSLAACVGGVSQGGLSGGGATGDEGSSLLSTENIATMVLGFINPLLGLLASVLFKVYGSLTAKIDTCNSLEEARQKGSRHEATFHAKMHDMCHFIEEVSNGGSSGMNKEVVRYRYCCYDDVTTRIIVEQSKAQFAKDWQHCTDITLAELATISFAACDPEELDNSVDGTKLGAYASLTERTSAYQFTHKCIDTREYMKVLLKQFGGGDMLIDTTDMERILGEMK